jgi:hypothetical protein
MPTAPAAGSACPSRALAADSASGTCPPFSTAIAAPTSIGSPVGHAPLLVGFWLAGLKAQHALMCGKLYMLGYVILSKHRWAGRKVQLCIKACSYVRKSEQHEHQSLEPEVTPSILRVMDHWCQSHVWMHRCIQTFARLQTLLPAQLC